MAKVKFYLNQRLKPKVEDNTKKYPLYIEVYAFQQRSQFKVRNKQTKGGIYNIKSYYSEEEFNQTADLFELLANEQSIAIKSIFEALTPNLKHKPRLNNFSKVYDLFFQSFMYGLEKDLKERMQYFLEAHELTNFAKIINWDIEPFILHKHISDILDPKTSLIIPDEYFYSPIHHEFLSLIPSGKYLEFIEFLKTEFLKKKTISTFQVDLSSYNVFFDLDNTFLSSVCDKFKQTINKENISGSEEDVDPVLAIQEELNSPNFIASQLMGLSDEVKSITLEKASSLI